MSTIAFKDDTVAVRFTPPIAKVPLTFNVELLSCKGESALSPD